MNKEEKKISGAILYEGRVLTLHKDNILCPNGAKTMREYVTHNGGVCILMEIDNRIYDDTVPARPRYSAPLIAHVTH